MKRKLKKALRDIYIKENPSEIKSFTEKLSQDPVWRELHPVRRVSHTSGLVKSAVMGVTAVGAIGAVIGVYALNGHVPDSQIPSPPENPIITTIYSSTTTQATQTIQNTLTTPTETAVTITATSAVTSYINVNINTNTTSVQTSAVPAEYSTENLSENSNSTPDTQLFRETNTQISEETAVKPSETATETVTSVYRSHIFPHDYTENDVLENLLSGNSVVYGYPDSKLFLSEDSLFMFSSLILEGEITGVDYTVIDGKPWTVVKVRPEKIHCLNDKRVTNVYSEIEIYEAGGYMPLSEYVSLNPDDKSFDNMSADEIDSTLLYEDGSNHTEQSVGGKYLFFLSEPNVEGLPENAFYRACTGCDTAQFYLNGDKYVCCDERQNFDFTLENLRQLIPYSLNFYDMPDSDKKIMVVQKSVLLTGTVQFYSVSENGDIEPISDFSTDDGFKPFDDDYSVETTPDGETVYSGDFFRIIWTDSGASVDFRTDYMSENFDESLEIDLK